MMIGKVNYPPRKV